MKNASHDLINRLWPSSKQLQYQRAYSCLNYYCKGIEPQPQTAITLKKEVHKGQFNSLFSRICHISRILWRFISRSQPFPDPILLNNYNCTRRRHGLGSWSNISGMCCHIPSLLLLHHRYLIFNVRICYYTHQRNEACLQPREGKTVKQMSGWKMAALAGWWSYFSSSISETEWSSGSLGWISIESFGKRKKKRKKWVTEYTLWWIFHKAPAAQWEDRRQTKMAAAVQNEDSYKYVWQMLCNIAVER